MEQKIPLKIMIFLGTLVSMGPLLMDLYLPVLPQLPRLFNVSTSMIQLTLTMTMVGLAVGQLVMGPLSDRYGRRMPLLIGMIGSAIAAFAFTQVHTIELLFLMRFLQGFFGSTGLVLSRAIVRDLSTKEMLGQTMALLMIFQAVAPIIGTLIGGQVTHYFGWSSAFYTLVGICLALAVRTMYFKETLTSESRIHGNFGDIRNTYITLMKDPTVIACACIQWFSFGGYFAYVAGSPFLFQIVYGLSGREYSYIFAVMATSVIIASIIGKKYSATYSPVQILRVGLLVSVVGSIAFLCTMYNHGPLWLTIACLSPTISTMAIMNANTAAIAMKNYPHLAGSGAAILGFSSLVAGGLMAPLVGIAGGHTGIPLGIILVIVHSVSLCIFMLFIGKNKINK